MKLGDVIKKKHEENDNLIDLFEKVPEEETKAIDEDVMEIDFFESTTNDYDEFDEHAWNKGEGYIAPNFPEVNKRLEGLEAGLYLFAAESNMGKSALMANMLYDYATHRPNKLFGLYYSLDDTRNELVPRIIAMNKGIPISVASKPKRYKEFIDSGMENSAKYREWLNKREEGLQELKENKDVFKIEDSNRITCVEDLEKHMKQAQVYVKTLDPDANIIVAIDSINDLRFKHSSYGTVREKHDEAARLVKQWTVNLDIPIFASIHLRKGDGTKKRPDIDMIKESGEYVYEASLVWLLHNDVSKNKQAAKIYRNIEGSQEKGAVIEMDWAKNKKSSFKGRTYCYFSPEHSKTTEVGEDVATRFNALVYEI